MLQFPHKLIDRLLRKAQLTLWVTLKAMGQICLVAHKFVSAFEPWGIFVAIFGLVITSIGFMVELEDRQSERIIRAWESVLTTTARIPISDVESVPRSSLRQSLEYLNRQFQGRWCHDYVRRLSVYFTGNYRRHCIFPDKRRESLSGLSLTGLDLSRADLRDADLQSATLRNTVLRAAHLDRAKLTEADLRNADLGGADLDRAVLTGADLANANLKGAKGLLCPQLRAAKNWNTTSRDLPALLCLGRIP